MRTRKSDVGLKRKEAFLSVANFVYCKLPSFIEPQLLIHEMELVPITQHHCGMSIKCGAKCPDGTRHTVRACRASAILMEPLVEEAPEGDPQGLSLP